MQTIQKVAKVVNNQVIINLPPDYANEVEVTLRPLIRKDLDIYELEREIDMGKKSPLSPKTHSEIFANLRKKYGSF